MKWPIAVACVFFLAVLPGAACSDVNNPITTDPGNRCNANPKTRGENPCASGGCCPVVEECIEPNLCRAKPIVDPLNPNEGRYGAEPTTHPRDYP